MRLATGIVLILAGTVWALQGLGADFAPSSPMTGNRIWVMWGGLAVTAGGVLIWFDRKRR